MLKGSAFPLEVGKNKVTTGTFPLVKGVRCYVDGDLVINFRNGTSATESFVAGEDMELSNTDDVTISSGTFSFTTK